ncbi:hypothetical protein GYMLUDRAFT_241116 [Collybiopsis luxurians FD-317 M1]|nr:hypothetical protein GYMLUDRAFT_241116 [Collybiopsis luxurians FD-317 M1]
MAKLDTLGQTAAKAKSSDWNLILISILVDHAKSQAAQARNPIEYSHPDHVVPWEELIASRINRILDDLYRSHPRGDEDSGTVEVRMKSRAQANGLASRRQATRLWKFKRRLKQGSIEQGKCNDAGDNEGEQHWEFVVFATSVLEVQGMSDEEDGEENGDAIRLVSDVSFQHREFRSLYCHSDTVGNMGEDGFGIPSGCKFKKRVDILESVDRPLPAQLPDAFRKPPSGLHNHDLPLESALLSASAYFYHWSVLQLSCDKHSNNFTVPKKTNDIIIGTNIFGKAPM